MGRLEGKREKKIKEGYIREKIKDKGKKLFALRKGCLLGRNKQSLLGTGSTVKVGE